MSEQGFCPFCDVSMDLHPNAEQDERACGVALQKANLLSAFLTDSGSTWTP